MNTKIKICGLSRAEDIEYANAARPDYIGFVFAKSRRQVSPGQAAELVRKLDPDIPAVGVFVNESIDGILNVADKKVIRMIQLHGQEKPEDIEQLKKRTACPVIKAVQIGTDHMPDLNEYEQAGIDFYLFDHKTPGSGRSFDWSLIPKTKKPFFLAGGINPDNVREAMTVTSPFAVDVSSGVETDGKKDEAKMREIVRRVRNDQRKIWRTRWTIYSGDSDE